MDIYKGDDFMFVKIIKIKKYQYIKLVESYWEDGTSKHRVLYNFGRCDLIKNDQMFINMVKKLCEIVEIPLVEQKSPLPDCSDAAMLNYGYLGYKKLWEDMGIANCMRSIQEKSKITFSLADTAFLMALQHLLKPESKHFIYNNQSNYYGLKEIELQHLYRCLDQLVDQKEFIEQSLFEQNYIHINQRVDVVFYDVTTFAFESVIADVLKDFGLDAKCKEVQVVMGLLIDSNGLPIGYELFPGNTFDGKTLVKSLQNVKKRFGINRVIIVADRGINSKGNLNLIKEAGYGYIVTSKIKSMKKSIQKQILDPSGYMTLAEDIIYKPIDYQNCFTDENKQKHVLEEKLIVAYSIKRAQRDQKDRQWLIEKAHKILQQPGTIKAASKRGGKKYLLDTSPKDSIWVLDEEKIKEDSMFDGYYGIQTSEKQMAAADILDACHTLWKIEESFRIMKSTLEVRPVFHWTPGRIHGHFLICFLSFLMERKMELLLSDQGKDSSPEKIREALNSMQLASVTLNNESVYIKTKNEPLGTEIFRKLGLKRPKNISQEQDLKDCFNIKKKKSWGQPSLF